MTYGNQVYTFYIVGVYRHEDSGVVLSSTDEEPSTDIYLPLSAAKAISHGNDGYSQLTVVPNTGVDTQSFLEQT